MNGRKKHKNKNNRNNRSGRNAGRGAEAVQQGAGECGEELPGATPAQCEAVMAPEATAEARAAAEATAETTAASVTEEQNFRRGDYRKPGPTDTGSTRREMVEPAGSVRPSQDEPSPVERSGKPPPPRRQSIAPRPRRKAGAELPLLAEPRGRGWEGTQGCRPAPVDLAYRCGPCGAITLRPALRRPVVIRGTRVGAPSTLRSCPTCDSQDEPVLIEPNLEMLSGEKAA